MGVRGGGAEGGGRKKEEELKYKKVNARLSLATESKTCSTLPLPQNLAFEVVLVKTLKQMQMHAFSIHDRNENMRCFLLN